MRKPLVQDLVYNKIYPRPRPNDPVSFLPHIQRCLVPEVREEVQRYYGRIDCLEAQYPGLDYTYTPHRRRLASFPWHRRLFRAFDDLGLTSEEILSLCTWEGTRAAKERYERDSRSSIECTTLSGVEAAPEGRGPKASFHVREQYRYVADQYSVQSHAAVKRKVEHEAEHSDDDDENEIDESIGVRLNEQLRAAADARDRGELALFDEQWEQWMKEALERNEMDLDTILDSIRRARPFPLLPEAQPSSSSTAMLSTVMPELDGSVVTPTLSTISPTVAASAQTYDELHDMLDELQSNNNRLAADNAAMAHFLSRSRTETAR